MVYYLNSFFYSLIFFFWRSCYIHIKHTMYLQNDTCSSWTKWRRNYICNRINWDFKLQFSYLKISWLKLTNIFLKWLLRHMPFCKRREFAYYRFIRTKAKFESRWAWFYKYGNVNETAKLVCLHSHLILMQCRVNCLFC